MAIYSFGSCAESFLFRQAFSEKACDWCLIEEWQRYSLLWILVQGRFLVFLFCPIRGFAHRMMSFMSFHKYLDSHLDLISLLGLLNLLFLFVLARTLLLFFLFELFLFVNLNFLFSIFHKFHIFVVIPLFKFQIICFRDWLIFELKVLFQVRKSRYFFYNLNIFQVQKLISIVQRAVC